MNYDILVDGTNFKISKNIYDLLVRDCYYFGFVKNNKANISGFLNHLIYHLAVYREDLHNTFLKKNNNNVEIVSIIENNIYSIYLKEFDITDDTKKSIQLRINKEHKSIFVKIIDEYLEKYNLDFTNYIRTLLLEYAVRPLYQREYYNIYIYSQIIVNAQKLCKFVKVRTDNDQFIFVPVGIELSPFGEQIYIFGFTKDKDIAVIKYSEIKFISMLEYGLNIENDDYIKLFEKMHSFFNSISQKIEDGD